MPRFPRQTSSIGMEHVMLRGINRQLIFLNDADRKRFLKCLCASHEKADFTLHAYCLMSNHVHLLIQVKDGTIGEIVQSFATSYAVYFNKQHGRVGHLFQGRFRSVPIEREDSYLRAIRYILRNPVAAGICDNASDYRWSNYHSLGTDDGVADSRFLTKIAELDYIKSFINSREYDEEMDQIESSPVTNPEVLDILRAVSGLKSTKEFNSLSEEEQAKYICRMINRGCKVFQIREVFGISEYRMRKYRVGSKKKSQKKTASSLTYNVSTISAK